MKNKENLVDLNQYVKDSLRTESKLEEFKIPVDTFEKLLRVYINLGEILDAYKKNIFYNKDKKLKEEYIERLTQINVQIALLMRQGLSETPKTPSENVTSRVFHGILGIMTESAELAEILHKSLVDSTIKIDPIHIQEELGDGMALGWYPAILHDALNLDPKDTLRKNIAKLKVRFPEKYTDEHADNRDLVAERSELEK